MKFVKNKIFWLILFLVILGTALRLIFINKPEGLWNDEYVSWSIAAIPYGKTFWHAVFAQCHMPFYYFYLKFFIHFLGNNDVMLRLTSVLPGILSIVSMYFVGREIKNEKTGVLCASIAALSSFLIYFSQEVRFYEVLFLFSSLSLIFMLRLSKEQNLINFLGFIISSLLIIFTHTLGIIFVILSLVLLSFVLNLNKKNITTAWSAILICTLICLPLMAKIFTCHPYSQWWGHFSLAQLGFLITDYFSPILTNIVSSPDKFFYSPTLGFIIFALIPSAIAITGIIKALITDTKRLATLPTCLLALCLAYLLILVMLALTGKLLFITKYTIEIYPILIALMAYGLLEFKKGWRYVLIFAFCFLNLFYVLSNPNSAPKLHRPEGHKLVVNLIKNAGLSKNDFIILNYYPKERFEKYFDFSNYNVISINKNNFEEYLGIKTKEDLMNSNPAHFDQRFKSEVLNKLMSNQKVSIVVLKDVAIYSPVQMYTLFKDKKAFEKTPFLFLVFSQVRNDILENCLKNLQIQRIEEKGSWSVITFVKK